MSHSHQPTKINQILHLNQVPAVLAKLSNAALHAQIVGTNEASVQILSMNLSRIFPKTILVVPGHKDASPLLAAFEANKNLLAHERVSVSYLPHLSLWGTDRFINPSLSRTQRLDSVFNLRAPDKHHVVVTTLAGLMQQTLPPELIDDYSIRVTVGSETDQDDLIKKLENSGYKSTTMVDEEGLFSVRGSVIDIYPPNLEFPVRVEWIGDEVTSIRQFNLSDQKSKQALDFVTLGPAHDILIPDPARKDAAQRLHEYLINLEGVSAHDKDGFGAAFIAGSKPAGWDLLGPILREKSRPGFFAATANSCVVFVKGIDPALAQYAELNDHFKRSHEKDIKAGRVSVDPARHFPEVGEVKSILDNHFAVIETGSPFDRQDFHKITIAPESGFEGVNPTLSGSARFDSWMQAITNLVHIDHGRVCILATSQEQIERISTLLTHRELPVSRELLPLSELLEGVADGTVHVTEGYLQNWIWLSQSKTLLLPEHLMFGITQRKQKSSSAKLKNFLSSFRDLKVGDLVVHVKHGIGRYKGMASLTVGGITADFLNLEYAGTDKIYLPVDKLNLLQRYSAGEGAQNPSLDKLGGSTWDRKRSHVKAAVKEMADKLIRLQAQRALAHVHVYEEPGDDYFKFEAEFPYEETPDQVKAIQEVNADLEGKTPMDRLICGDVGFGKTEVALRAAFRVASEGLQVLVLVPTTILCYQHYRTFSDRLGRHGLKVAQVNRFVPAKEQKAILTDLEAGKIDILVGTHRLLSEDIKTKRLGLIIVDEEQRFGVTHKERLKELRAGADILTLTATPIPRTLHMAMLGLRDISIITTPPSNRMSVKTYIARMDESIIRESLEHELDRGGQAFFLHNRVEDIEATTLWVKSLVPKANVRFAHGQMKETDLETTIIDFIEHKFDVLVCTTIIESGVDMPNVNTLIVSNADRFGLAQLYQMRGRVGRSSVQAYAYFLTKEPSLLTDDSRRRLEVLATHQELGAGFQIASHDLEIRGAGNLLGAEQSGHVSDVGLEMYTDLLGEAIAELRGQMPQKTTIDTEIKLPVTALIPESYIQDEGLRLQFYKSLFSAERRQDIADIADELTDRFGPRPDETERLIIIAKMKVLLSALGATQISMNPKGGWFEIRFGSLNEKQIDKMITEARKRPNLYRLSPDYKLFIYWIAEGEIPALDKAPPTMILKTLLDVIEPLAAGLEAP